MACYYGTGTGSFDLENVLFYNIGSAPFRPFAANRIFAETVLIRKQKQLMKERNSPIGMSIKSVIPKTRWIFGESTL